MNGTEAILELATDPARVEDREAIPVRAEGIDFADVLVNWLREVLYRAQAGDFAPKRARVESVSETLATGELRGERFDAGRHVHREELKGVTRHDVRIERTEEGLSVRVVIDV